MNMISLFSDKQFYKTAIKLALPIALQNLILSSLNLVDNIIIGGLGETVIASVGLANQYFFLLNLVLFGVVSGASVFTSQYWGKKDLKNIKKILGLCLITSVTVSTIFTAFALIAPHFIIGLFSNDKNVILIGGNYLRIISLSYIVTAISFTYSITFRSIGKVKIPMFVSAIALGINSILNFLLVYGIGSFHGFGAYGSAIGTLIARFLEFSMMLFTVYKFKTPLAATIKELFDLSLDFTKGFIKLLYLSF